MLRPQISNNNSLRCSHEMPFGASIIPGNGVQFQLWAPNATKVEVLLRDDKVKSALSMERAQAGWHRFITDRAQAGSLYRFRINGVHEVPDPASRYQPEDVHSWSQVIDPLEWQWEDITWFGRPWEEAIIYETHVGTFTQAGTFAALTSHLDYLVDLGVTALELMPIGDFPGRWNWGYDGVLPFAPDSRYGTPNELKALVQTAHNKGLMVFLDVVYNHFGPEGNYLGHYAPQFFTDTHHTPWGAAINFDDKSSRTVRDFFIHNALFWLLEYRFDGLRFDAVHAIIDDSIPHILDELAECVQGATSSKRHVHLMLENDNNTARYLRCNAKQKPSSYVAQWNDDTHHALHVLVTGEKQGYYADYAQQPIKHLARSLCEGFAYQGEFSAYRGGARGEKSETLPAVAFINFLQNHDQVGNRALGERINSLAPKKAVRAVTALLLLAPHPPLLFMGQEWGSTKPFPFFCDFSPPLAEKVSLGRRDEFARFPEFTDPEKRQRIPDPNAESTFRSAVLNGPAEDNQNASEWIMFYRQLLQLRERIIIPLLLRRKNPGSNYQLVSEQCVAVLWDFGNKQLMLLTNLGEHAAEGAPTPFEDIIYATDTILHEKTHLPPWFVGWYQRPSTPA